MHGGGCRGGQALTQPQGELVEAFQLGDQGADGAPGALLQPQVPGVLDGLGGESASGCPQGTVGARAAGAGAAPTSRISCPAPV